MIFPPNLFLLSGFVSCQLQSLGIPANHLENKRVSACCHFVAELAAQLSCLTRYYSFI